MQILYGNDGVNYRLIDKSTEMSDGIQKSMLATYSKYEFVTKSKAYSSVDKEPETITYVTSNLDNQMSSEQLVVCKTGHMSQFSSPSYYFHGIIKEVSEDFYKREFFEIFSYRFVEDTDALKYSDSAINNYNFIGESAICGNLSTEQLIVILARFMSNEKNGQKTKILVDATGDDYNRRSREILSAIYHYLPYELRKRYGFKSYTQDDRNIPARVAFVLFNRDETYDNGEYITLQESVLDIEKKIDAQYLDYAKYLVEELDEEAREKHFEALSRLAKNGRLKIEECLTYYNNMNKWANGTQEDLLPDWIQYIDQNSFRKGPLYEALLDIIVQKVDNNYYNDYLFENILKLYKENIYSLSPLATKTIRFADCLDEIYIQPERFSEWYRSLLDEKTKRFDPESSAYGIQISNIYQTEIDMLKATDIMSEEFTELVQSEIRYLEEQKTLMAGDLEQQKEKELENVGRMINSFAHASITEYGAEVQRIWNEIQFEDNKKTVALTIEELLEHSLGHRIRNEKEWNEYDEFYTVMKGIVSAAKYEKIASYMKAEYDRIQVEKRARVVVLNKENIFRSYRDLTEALREGSLDENESITLRTGTREYSPQVKLVKLILQFALCPEDKYIEHMRPIASKLLMMLLGTDVLRVEHIEPLFRIVNSEDGIVEKILNYYLVQSNPVMVSGIYLAKLIEEYHPDLKKEIIQLYEEHDGEAAIMVDELEGTSKSGQDKKKGLMDLLGGKK